MEFININIQSEEQINEKKLIHIIKNEKNIPNLLDCISKNTNLNIRNHNEPKSIDLFYKNFYKVSITFNHFWTPIMYAIYFKKIEFLKILLENKADPNICEYYGISPLTMAIIVHQNNTEYAKLLIQYGANINAGKINALHILAKMGNDRLLDFILKMKPIIDYIDMYNNTPLIYACLKGHIKCIRLLLYHKANINIVCHNKNILICLILMRNEENYYQTETTIEYLLSSSQIDIQFADSQGKTAIMYAIEKKYFDIVNILITRHACIHSVDSHGRNLLMYAAIHPNKFFFQSLIQKGVDVTHLDHDKNNIIMYLCKFGNTPCLSLLLSYPIDINHTNDYFINAYIVCKYYKQNKCKNILLNQKVITDDLNQNDDSYYPYYYLIGGIMDSFPNNYPSHCF